MKQDIAADGDEDVYVPMPDFLFAYSCYHGLVVQLFKMNTYSSRIIIETNRVAL